MYKPRAIYFYQYLPPWRIDVFNELGKYYDLTIIFTNSECEGFTYNRQELLDQLVDVKTIFLSNGFKIGKRPIRFGILRLLKTIRPSIVFAHEYAPTSVLLSIYRQLNLYRFKYYITTSDNLQIAQSCGRLKSYIRRYILAHADGIIVYSKNVEDWYKQQFPQLKTGICPNIQNPNTLLAYRKQFSQIIQRFQTVFKLDNSPIILYIGRLVQVKGIDLLIEAFSKTKDTKYKLVIVGEGKEKESLIKIVKEKNLQDRVIFAGFYTGVELYAWYDMANFFVLPSRYEPFGAVVNEALVYGCPVLASKYIGALDFINETNGLVFDPLDNIEFVNYLQLAMGKYIHRTYDRENLMPCSFDKYVKVFHQITQ